MTYVLTRLRDGDELGSYPGHLVERTRNLAELYGTTARAIVEANGVPFKVGNIDAWVMRTGGKRLANGQSVFTAQSVIKLPTGGPRAPVVTSPPTSAPAVAGFGLLGTVAAVLLYLGFK